MFWLFFVPYAAAVAVWLAGGAVPDVGNSGWRIAGDYLFSACNVLVAAWLLRARPRDVVSRVLAVGMLGTAATFNYQSHSFFTREVLGPPDVVEQLHTLLHVVSGLAYLFAVVAFPDGRLPPELPRRWQAAKAGVYLLAAAQVAVLASANRASGHPGQGFFLLFFAIAIPLTGVFAQSLKLRTLKRETDRRVARLLRGALLPLLVVGVAFAALDADERLGSAVLPGLFAIVPLALVVAILRYRLFDIELVIRRTLVYGALVGLLGAAYVVTVVFVGSNLGATALVAIAFDPLRRKMQVAVNRFLFGRRVAPYEALASLAQALARVTKVDDVLPRAAHAAASAVGATGARATVLLADGSRRSAMSGREGDEQHSVEVCDGPEVIGTIEVQLPRGGALDRASARVLRQIAVQAAPAFASVRADAALRREIDVLERQQVELDESRQRLLAARGEARREVERAISTHVMPRLVDVNRALSARPPDIGAARSAATRALEELRNVAHGVYPPVLADQGLEAALQTTSRGRQVEVVGVRRLRGRRFPAPVESGAYFCLAHTIARATGALRVQLGADQESLWFRVTGSGADPGDQLVADRVAALDGELVAERKGFRATLPVTRPLAESR